MDIIKDFDCLVIKYEKMIRQLAYKHVGHSWMPIEDAVIDCYYHLYNKWETIQKNADNQEHYVRRLIKNFYIDLYRKLQKENERTSFYVHQEEIYQKEIQEFENLISVLKLEEKEIITMYHLQCFSNQVIAAHFDITEVALRKRIERIHKKLKAYISNMKEEPMS